MRGGTGKTQKLICPLSSIPKWNLHMSFPCFPSIYLCRVFVSMWSIVYRGSPPPYPNKQTQREGGEWHQRDVMTTFGMMGDANRGGGEAGAGFYSNSSHCVNTNELFISYNIKTRKFIPLGNFPNKKYNLIFPCVCVCECVCSCMNSWCMLVLLCVIYFWENEL